MDLRDKVCLVTGASSGIGRATAMEMVRRGAHVALVSRNEKRLEAAHEEIVHLTMTSLDGRQAASGPSTHPNSSRHVCDVGERNAVQAMVRDVLTAHGRIDVLFANAGYGHFSPLTELADDEIEDMIRTNVLGQIWCAKAALPHMMERRSGHIVVMSSTNGRIPPPLQTVYNATKFAAVGFAETLLYEVEAFGIGVSIVYPGAIDTDFFRPEEFSAMRTPKKIPPERVARAVCNGIERGAYDISVPGILRIPAVFRALLPPLVRRGVRRYAAAVVPRPGK